MASQPSEPDRYSIDQMMERLKKRPSAEEDSGDGELVTRADGTQAIKVRRRKRRSHQPHKERQGAIRKSRMIQLSAVLALLFVVLLLAGVAIIYANSRPFRDGLVAKLATSSGASAELQRFRMNPATANASRVLLKWPEGNVLERLDLQTVRALVTPSSFLGRDFVGEEVTAGSGKLTLLPPVPGEDLRSHPPAEGGLPLHFKRYAVGRLDIVVGDPWIFRINRLEASLYPENANGRPQLLLSRGDVEIPKAPRFRLERAHIEFRGRTIDIVGMRLRDPEDNRGVFELAGLVSPYAPDSPSTLAVRLESLPIATLAGPDLGHLVSGRVDSYPSAESNYLTFHPLAEPDAALAVEFRNSPTETISMRDFPFLKALHHLLDDQWFEVPEFDDESKGVIHRAKGNVTLGNLDLVGKGRLAIRGRITMAPNRALSGELRVGVADAMIRSARNPRLDAIFGSESEGFRWITLKPAGTAMAPSDNFRRLYDSQETTPAADGSARDGSVPSFEDLTRPRR